MSKEKRIQATILDLVSNWPCDEGDYECTPSAVCWAVADSEVGNYYEAVDQLSVLCASGQLGHYPSVQNLGDNLLSRGPRKPGLFIRQKEP